MRGRECIRSSCDRRADATATSSSLQRCDCSDCYAFCASPSLRSSPGSVHPRRRARRRRSRRVAAFGGGAIFSEVEKGYSVWDGLCFAVTTMTPVGYGLSPHATGGRILAIALMLIGIGFVALLTGASPAVSQSTDRRSVEAAEADVAADVGDIRVELARELRGISARLQELEQMVQRIGVPEGEKST